MILSNMVRLPFGDLRFGVGGEQIQVSDFFRVTSVFMTVADDVTWDRGRHLASNVFRTYIDSRKYLIFESTNLKGVTWF